MIVYAVVARGSIVLAEYTANNAPVDDTPRMVLSRISHEDQKMSYTSKALSHHYIVENTITFLCTTAGEQTRYNAAFSFLEDVKNRCFDTYGGRLQNAIAFAINESFHKVLRERAQHFNENPDSDAIAKCKQEIAQVRDVMLDNIDRMLERGEKLELLIDKSSDLNESAQVFHRSSKKLSCTMWCMKMRFYAFLFALLLILTYTVLAFLCDPELDDCFGHGHHSNSTIAPTPSPSPTSVGS